MAEAFKNLFSKEYFQSFVSIVKKFYPPFDERSFLAMLFDKDWENKELKQRARHTSQVLHQHLTDSYASNVNLIVDIVDFIQNDPNVKPGIEAMFFPDYIEVYGLDDYKISMAAMEKITQFFSCEFAIRPFLMKYPKKGMEQMKQWSGHAHPMVRRLSSEGARPRLPWGIALPFLKEDPSPLLPILEKLKEDPSESVRRSVANNLNDIAKDNPEWVIELATKWKGKSKDLDWVVKHGCRTLLKKADPQVLALFGYGSTENIQIENLKVSDKCIQVGDSLEFSFDLGNTSENDLLIRLEYGIYYLLANGKHSKKVFKISENTYAGKATRKIIRKQSFRPITTRKYYPGIHQMSLIVNGKESEKIEFELKV